MHLTKKKKKIVLITTPNASKNFRWYATDKKETKNGSESEGASNTRTFITPEEVHIKMIEATHRRTKKEVGEVIAVSDIGVAGKNATSYQGAYNNTSKYSVYYIIF